jgi:pimeloyl-ACP methyl ester carboxylesterase
MPLHMRERSTFKKVVDIAITIFTFPFVYPIKTIARWAILPSSSPFFHKIIKRSSQNFEIEARSPQLSRIEVKTPDGINLKGHFLEGKNFKTNPNKRVVILFHGNGDFYQSRSYPSGVASLLTPHEDYSFLMFNPRGIGISDQMTPSENTLTLDGESIYQLAMSLGFKEDQIDITGHSLGAAVAAQLKKLHPKTGGRLILDSRSNEINPLFPKLVGRVASFAARKLGWKFETAKALEQIEDEVFIINHLRDEIIRKQATLTKENLKHLAHKRNLHIYNITEPSYNNHMGPLRNFYEISYSLEQDLNLREKEIQNLSA